MEMTSGGIFLDGVNIENISAQSHKRRMTVLFQKPVHYHAFAFDNIAYGDMDSWAENDWLSRFKSLPKDSTTIIITHRFTTAMHADVIFVVQDSRVIETGTHMELMEKEGMYAESWKQQTAGHYHCG